MPQTSLRPPPTLQPRPKAVPTSSSNVIAASSTNTKSQHDSTAHQSRQSSPVYTSETADASDRATAAFVRRVLSPQSHTSETKPIDELLPPLTSSNTVDLQLYAIIAIVVKDAVQNWYGAITPDETFVEEVIKIIAHCTRALESRLRTIDLEVLILDEIPDLIEKHIYGKYESTSRRSPQTANLQDLAYRISHSRTHPLTSSTDPRVLYQQLNPHPALQPVPNIAIPSTISEQLQNEVKYRQLLVQGALAVLLPTEDLENACLRTLVADVIAGSILGNAIGGKLSEGWFIWSSLTNFLKVVKVRLQPQATGEALQIDTRNRLEQFGLLERREKASGKVKNGRRSTISALFWQVLQFIYLVILTFRYAVVSLVASTSQRPRSIAVPRPAVAHDTSRIEKQSSSSGACRRPAPMLSFRIFSLLSTLLDLPLRTPWLSGILALLQHHLIRGSVGLLRIGATDGILDR